MPRLRFPFLLLLLALGLLLAPGCAHQSTDNSVTTPSRFLQKFDFQQFYSTHLAPLGVHSTTIHPGSQPGDYESSSGAFATLRPIPNYDPQQWNYLDRSSQYHTATFLNVPDRLTPVMETTVRELKALITANGGRVMGQHGSTTVGTSDQLDAAAEVTLDYHDNHNFGTVTVLLVKTDQAQGYALTVIINEVD